MTATAAGVSGSVDFTALGDPSGAGLNVSISDSRNYAQTLHVLTYTIPISNSTSSNEAAVDVIDTLPPELDLASAQWQCIPVNGATCTAAGGGNIVDTIDLPAGSGVVYLLTALVNNAGSDTVVNTVEVTGSGGTFTASDSTTIVIFRDSFELGGDGAEWPANAPPSVPLGTLDGTASIALDLDPARIPHTPTVVAATSDGALRIDAVRIGEQVWLRMTTRVDGSEQVSAWSRLDAADALLGTYLDESGTRHILLIGTAEDLDLSLQSRGPLRLESRG